MIDLRALRRTSILILTLIFAAGQISYAEDDPPPAAPVPDEAPAAQPAPAEEPAPVPVEVPIEDLGPVVVTATRLERPVQIVPRSVNVVPARRIRERGIPSTLDALDDEVGLWIEKRTAHTSDLVIRGLSGANLLALVDGNTLSTFWGEGGFAGDDMYGKIDPDMIERIEVVRGPSSVLYGSNALGGVVNFITKRSPYDYTCAGSRFGSHTRVTASSAPEYVRIHQAFYGATPRLRWLVAGTYWDGGDTRDGGGQNQSPTGGDGVFANAALDFKLAPSSFLGLTVQHTNNFDAFRYYRPNQENSNYRLAVALKLDLENLGRRTRFADEGHITLYFQEKEDERRWFNAAGVLTQTGIANWLTLSGEAQFTKRLGRHEITYGVELETTWGESPDDEQFTITPVGGTKQKASPDSIWSSFGGYVQDVWDVNPRLTLTGSVRYDLLRIETDVDQYYVPAGGLNPLEDQFTDYESALVGGLQANYKLSECSSIYGGWTRGFRQFAPLFGVVQTGFGVLAPSQFLDPVTADQFEVGFKHRTQYVEADLAAYYTRFRNFQNIVTGTFLGLDWYDFNGNGVRDPGEDVSVRVGNGKAYVYGVELWGQANLALLSARTFGRYWTFGGGFMWNYGQDETNDIPLRHTHPARGTVRLRYENDAAWRKPWFEVAAQFVHRYTRIPPDRLAGDVGYLEDPQDPASGMRRPYGLPGYNVVDVRGGFKVTRNVTLTLGVDNVFDALYRPAHARWDAPGRSFHATLDVEL